MKKRLETIDDFIEFVESKPAETWAKGHTYNKEMKTFCMYGQLALHFFGEPFVNRLKVPENEFQKYKMTESRLHDLLKNANVAGIEAESKYIAAVNDNCENHEKVREHWLNVLNQIKNAQIQNNN